MPSDADDVGRLRAAIDAHERFVAEHGQRSASDFLAEHEQLRDLLEPLLVGTRPARQPSACVLGDFRLLGEIGRGGMGVVYDAEQISLGRRVAVKVLPGQLAHDPERRARFARESRLAATLDHPCIAKVISADADDDVIWFAMERIDGAPLDHVLSLTATTPAASMTGSQLASAVAEVARQHGVREARPEAAGASIRTGSTVWRTSHVDTVVRIGAQIAEALQHAHERGVVHRDVKPANVLLRRDGRAVLTDFGLARDLNAPSLTLTGDFVGTPSYCAPEQLVGDRASCDHRVDVFALGVTLYELLTHRRPFEASTTDEVRARILTVEPRRPRRLNPKIPSDLSSVLVKALEKDPGRRYQTAAAMAEDLRAITAGRPVRARPVRIQTRSWRWCRRNPWAAATLASLLGVVLILLAMSARLVRANAEQTLLAGVAMARAQDFPGALAEVMPLERRFPGAATRAAFDELFRRYPCLASHALVSEPDERVTWARFSFDGQRVVTTHERRPEGRPIRWRVRLWTVPSPEDRAVHDLWGTEDCMRNPYPILDSTGRTVVWLTDERTVSVRGPNRTSTIEFAERVGPPCAASMPGCFGVQLESSVALCDADGVRWQGVTPSQSFIRAILDDVLIWQRGSLLVYAAPHAAPRELVTGIGPHQIDLDPDDPTAMVVTSAEWITSWRCDHGELRQVDRRANLLPGGIAELHLGSKALALLDGDSRLVRLGELPLRRSNLVAARLLDTGVGLTREPGIVAVEEQVLRLWGMPEPRQLDTPAFSLEIARFEPAAPNRQNVPAACRLWATGLMTLIAWSFDTEGLGARENVNMPRRMSDASAAGRAPSFCGIAFDPGRAILACARGDAESHEVPGWVFVLPAAELRPAAAKSYDCRSDPNWIELSPDRRRLAAAEQDGGIEVWRYDSELRELTDRVALPPLTVGGARLSCVRFVGERFLLASVGDSRSPGGILRWDLDDSVAQPVPALATSEIRHALRCLVVSPDQKLVAAGGDDRIVCVMRVVWVQGKPELQPAWRRRHGASVFAVAFVERDGALILASADTHGGIRLWDAASGAERGIVQETAESEDEMILSLDFSPDGNHLAAARYGGRVLLWDMQRPRRCLEGVRDCADALLRLQDESR